MDGWMDGWDGIGLVTGTKYGGWLASLYCTVAAVFAVPRKLIAVAGICS